MHRLLIAVASLVEHRLRSAGSVVAQGLSCPIAHGIVLDQGLNLCSPALAGGSFTTGPPGKSVYTF